MLSAKHLDARTIAIKVRYDNFRLVTRAQTLAGGLSGEPSLQSILGTLLARTDAGKRPVRLLGVTASKLFDPGDLQQQAQLGLF